MSGTACRILRRRSSWSCLQRRVNQNRPAPKTSTVPGVAFLRTTRVASGRLCLSAIVIIGRREAARQSRFAAVETTRLAANSDNERDHRERRDPTFFEIDLRKAFSPSGEHLVEQCLFTVAVDNLRGQETA